MHYAKGLFLLARQCGAAGLTAGARHLRRLAIEASDGGPRRNVDLWLYGEQAHVLGWRLPGKLACAVDRQRRRVRRP